MKLFKNIAITTLAIALSIQSFAMVTANENPVDSEEMPPISYFVSHTGAVKDIEFNEETGLKKISLVNSEGEIDAYFFVDDETLIVPTLSTDFANVEKDIKITGYVPSLTPMILIYPPQYSVDVITFTEENLFTKADLFDSDLVSQDNTLKLNLEEETEIFVEIDGKLEKVDYTKEDLENKKLIVDYDVSTRSIPAITTPKRIIVLADAEEEPGIETDEEFDFSEILASVPSARIVVEDEIIIEEPGAYVIDNEIMVPVRVVSEALGYTVGWDDETRSVSIGDVSFAIGEVFENINLPAELKEQTTYVPLKFFTEVLGLNNAYFFEGQINIDDLEKMQ